MCENMGLQAIHRERKKRFTVKNTNATDVLSKVMKMPHIASAFTMMNEKKQAQEVIIPPKKENMKPAPSNPLQSHV